MPACVKPPVRPVDVYYVRDILTQICTQTHTQTVDFCISLCANQVKVKATLRFGVSGVNISPLY